jgi:CheY-like chemotaxis protein
MGQRLLFVDSDRTFLKEHQISLESAFDLEVVASPEGVLQRLEGGAYAAVLICVEVAENKGYALCSGIRKNPAFDDVKLVLISAKATEEEYRRHQGLKGRADLYLRKPIAPSALVAALTPLVPSRALDPDNPFGELVDHELGDDWLEGLKTSLEAPPSSPGSAPIPVPAAVATPVDTGRTRELEAQVAVLREETAAKGRRVQELEADQQQLHQQLNDRTLNLDELARRDQEVEALHATLGDREQQLAALHQELEALRGQLSAAQASQAGQAEVQQQEWAAALAAKDQELAEQRQALEDSLKAQAHLNETIEGMVAQHSALEGVHQGALLELAGTKEKAHTFQLEVAGLEATMRSQGRDLGELGLRIRQLETDLEASRAQSAERDQQLEAAQATHAQHQAELAELQARLAALKQELDEKVILHDGERLELMNGLDQKEAALTELSTRLAERQEVITTLEREQQELRTALEQEKEDLRTALEADKAEALARLDQEKQGVQRQLEQHQGRLQSLDGLLAEIQDRLRQGADLTRG